MVRIEAVGPLGACLLALVSPLPAAAPLLAPAPGSPFAAGSKPTDVAAGDLNGDRKLDLVVASSGSEEKLAKAA